MGCTSSTAAGGGGSNAPMRNAANILSASGAIPPDTPVALPVPEPGWDSHIPPLTMRDLERERDAFWDTRVQGRVEFWNGLQLALLAEDDATRGAILYSMGSTALYPAEDGGGIFCYDDSGVRYDVAWSIVYLPSSILSENQFSTPLPTQSAPSHTPASAPVSGSAPASSSSSAPTAPAATGTAAATAAAAAGPGPSSAPAAPASAAAAGDSPHSRAVSAGADAGVSAVATPPMPSPPAGPTVRFHVLTSDGGRLTLDAPETITKKDLVRVVRVKFGIPAVQQRVVVRGNLIEDNDATLVDMGVRAEHTVQVFIAPKAKDAGQEGGDMKGVTAG